MSEYNFSFGIDDHMTGVLNGIGMQFVETQKQAQEFVDVATHLPISNEFEKISESVKQTGVDVSHLSDSFEALRLGDISKLNQLGIDLKNIPNSNLVEVSYKGNSQVIQNDINAIQEYISTFADIQNVVDTTSNTIFDRIENLSTNLNSVKYSIESAYDTLQNTVIANLKELSPEFAAFYQENESYIDSWIVKIEEVGTYFDTLISSLDAISNIKNAYDDLSSGLTLLKTTGVETFTSFKAGLTGAITRMATFGLTTLTSIGTFIASMISATAAQLGFNLAVSLNPIGLAIGAIVAIGVAVYELINHWDTVKQWMFDFANWMWKHHPFKFIFDIIDRVFPEFRVAIKGLWDYIKNIFDGLWNWFAEKFQWIKDTIFGVQTTSIDVIGTGNVAASISATVSDAYNLLHPKTLASGNKDIGVQKKLDSVTGDKGKMTNVYITIDKLNDGGINLITNNYKDSEGQIKDFFMRLLMDATNQLNYTN